MPRATVPISTKTIEKVSLRGVLIEDFRSTFSFVPLILKMFHQLEISCYTPGTLLFGQFLVPCSPVNGVYLSLQNENVFCIGIFPRVC